MEEEITTITMNRLEELERAEYMLQCLEAYGVDDWSGYDEAKAEYRKWAKAEYRKWSERYYPDLY